MSYFHRFLLAFAACTTLLGVSSAQAQTIAFSQIGVTFEPEDRRKDSESPNTISREDCLRDDPTLLDPSEATNDDDARTVVQLDLSIGGSPARTSFIQIWVSQSLDCAEQNNRENTDSCSLVASKEISGSNTDTLFLRPRLALSEYRDDLPDADSVEDYPDEEVCNTEKEQPLTIYALLMLGDDVLASDKWTNIDLDTRAPDPPTELSADPGENLAFLKWTIEEEAEDEDLFGFTFYCSENTSDVPVASGDGGAGGASNEGGDAGCFSGDFQAGQLPDDRFKCGSIDGKGAREDITSRLNNNAQYAIAVAATDIVGNQGRLSPLACAEPALVYTFFEQYRDAGGEGGDFCSLAVGKTSSAWLLLLLAGFAWMFRRARGHRA